MTTKWWPMRLMPEPLDWKSAKAIPIQRIAKAIAPSVLAIGALRSDTLPMTLRIAADGAMDWAVAVVDDPVMVSGMLASQIATWIDDRVLLVSELDDYDVWAGWKALPDLNWVTNESSLNVIISKRIGRHYRLRELAPQK